MQCETVSTLKTLQIYHQPEKNYWMVMVLNVPKEIRTKDDGVEFEEYHNGDLHEAVYQRYLQHLYSNFCLQNGTFWMINQAMNHKLGELLQDYFDKASGNCFPHFYICC